MITNIKGLTQFNNYSRNSNVFIANIANYKIEF